MDIQEIISTLRHHTKSLADLRESSKEQLRAFVTNKEFPVEDRFQVWIEFCDKKYHNRLDEGELSPIGDWVEADTEYWQRGVDYGWDHFLDIVQEHWKYPDDPHDQRCVKYFTENKLEFPTVDEFKEFLIAENFGIMCFDW